MGGEWVIHRWHEYAEKTRAHERRHNKLLYVNFRSELCTRLVCLTRAFDSLTDWKISMLISLASFCSLPRFDVSLLPDIYSNTSNQTKASTILEPNPCFVNVAR